MEVAAAIAGSVVSSALSDNGSAAADAQAQAAQNAADIQAQTTAKQLALQQQMYNQSRTDQQNAYNQGLAYQAPYSFAGYNALDSLSGLFGLATPQGGSYGLSAALNANLPQTPSIVTGSTTPGTPGATGTGTGATPPASLNTALQALAAGTHPGFGNDPKAAKALLDNPNATDAQKLSFLQGIQKNYDYYGSPGKQSSNNGTKQAWNGIASAIDAGINAYNTPAPTPPTAQQASQTALANSYRDGSLATTAANPTTALTSFFKNPLYQLEFGNSGAAVDPNASVLDRFHTDPGYQFASTQGIKNLDASAAAKGNLLSGNHMQDLVNYNQGLANTQYDSYINRLNGVYNNYQGGLMSLAGLGSSAANQNSSSAANTGNASSQLASNYANNTNSLLQNLADTQGNAALAAGNARASSYTNQANNNNQMLGGIGSAISSYFNKPSTGGSWLNPDTGSYFRY
jgi:hypothetical protein